MKYVLILFGNVEIARNTLTLDCTFSNVIVFLWYILGFSGYINQLKIP